MPKWSVLIGDTAFPIIDVNIKVNGKIDYSLLQESLDRHIYTWSSESITWVKHKTHGDGKSIVLSAHSSKLSGKKIRGTDYVYLSDKNGVVKKYVRCNTIKNVKPSATQTKEQWNFTTGKAGDYIKFDSCNDVWLDNETPLYDSHIFKLAE